MGQTNRDKKCHCHICRIIRSYFPLLFDNEDRYIRAKTSSMVGTYKGVMDEIELSTKIQDTLAMQEFKYHTINSEITQYNKNMFGSTTYEHRALTHQEIEDMLEI